ncbi:hypothetical protein VTN49DRAFT_941 [Thermomyces lanuginosus]|uniref:uncharacterized protein n=1 Tax=Thermomyces lanuginosus TaxID=5541 RepID=UPI003743E8F3
MSSTRGPCDPLKEARGKPRRQVENGSSRCYSGRQARGNDLYPGQLLYHGIDRDLKLPLSPRKLQREKVFPVRQSEYSLGHVQLEPNQFAKPWPCLAASAAEQLVLSQKLQLMDQRFNQVASSAPNFPETSMAAHVPGDVVRLDQMAFVCPQFS